MQPHGETLSYFGLVFDTYRALRKLGLSVDIIPPSAEALAGYRLILAPGLMTPEPAFKAALTRAEAEVIVGPRFGARTADMSTPVPLPPALPGLDVTVARVESLRPGLELPLDGGGRVTGFRDVLEGDAEVTLRLSDGSPVMVRAGSLSYLAGWLDDAGLRRVLEAAATRAGLATRVLPEGVRCRETATELFYFNYGTGAAEIDGQRLPPAGVRRDPKGG